MTAPHDVPTAGQLVEAVREWLERDVAAATEGRVFTLESDREFAVFDIDATRHTTYPRIAPTVRMVGASSDGENGSY